MNADGTFFAVIGFSAILGALISLPGTDAAGHVILPLVGSVLAIAGGLPWWSARCGRAGCRPHAGAARDPVGAVRRICSWKPAWACSRG
jgi:hypothetical protein